MAIPKGEIVQRPMLARACGCVAEFQVYAVDRFRVERQRKFQSTRCPACVEKYAEEQRKTAPPKSEAFARLPAGTKVSLDRKADGSWSGGLEAEGIDVQAVAAGPQALTVVLARLWLAAKDAN